MKKPKEYYRIVHDWLHKHYGKPNKCENTECDGKGKRFEYALKHGFEHERNINNYIQLCSKCHRRYDWTPEKEKAATEIISGKYNQYLILGPEASKKKVLIVDDNKIFDSVKAAAEYLGCDRSSISQVLTGRRKTIYGKKVVYADS